MIRYLIDTHSASVSVPWWAYAVCGFLLPPIAVFVWRRSFGWMLCRAYAAGLVTWMLYFKSVDTYWLHRMQSLPPSASMAQIEAANGDGAPKLFVALCGWMPVGLYVGLWIGLWLLACHGWHGTRRLLTPTSRP